MEQKHRFIALATSGRFTINELSKDFGISRKTAHKYLARYEAEGEAGLHERSRRPHHLAKTTDKQIVTLVLAERRRRPTWGPKKIRDQLLKRHGIDQPPAESTIGLILQRHGLSKRRKRRASVHRVHPEHLTQPEHPNHVWTMDFKGWFVLGNDQCCYPLTVCDRYSHFILGCRGCLNQQYKGTLALNKRLMRYHGVPEIIRVDNGSPFASHALGGLSRLSVWWLEQGIQVEFITPASPYQNGSHERMHRDLKAEACKPPSVNLIAQNRRFERWRYEYNHERGHESLDMRRPAQLYLPSQRRLGEHDKMSYPEGFLVKKVSPSGVITHQGANFFLGEIFAGCRIGLYEPSEGPIQLHYANLHLGDLCFAGADPFRPPAYITRPQRKSSTSSNSKNKPNQV